MSGHHLFYVRLLALAYAKGVIWLTSQGAVESREARTHLEDLMASGAVQPLVLEPWPSRLKVLQKAGNAGALIVLPHADAWLTKLPMVQLSRRHKGLEYRALIMRPPSDARPVEGAAAAARRVVKLVAINVVNLLGHVASCNVKLYALIDPFGYRPDSVPKGTVAVQDPIIQRAVPTRHSARRRMGVLDNSLVVGLIGAIDDRKNPDIVAAACAHAFRQFAGQLLVVGRLSAELRERIESSGLTSQQLVIREGYASEEDLVAAATACDVIALLYDNAQSPSGVLGLACQVGASVLVPADTRLAEMAGMAGIDIACDIDALSAASALTSAVRSGLALRKTRIQEAASRLNDTDFTNKLIGETR
jgi:hypothetical protein